MTIRRAIVYKSDAHELMCKRKWSKMKELLAVISLVLSGVVAEAPAPYPPSGFRPAGPAFELPQKVSQTQNTQQQEYLPPPVDPRIPSTRYGFPEEDVSVQGLPASDQQPIFLNSPINGQQYSGSNFNSDIKNLDESYRQKQYQIQQDQYREFERQRQLEAAQARNRGNQGPRQFATETTASTTEVTTRNPEDFRTTESTTESLDLNEGETLDNQRDDKKEKVSVEVSKQKVQEYPGELFLSSLAQLQLQPQFVPFGQIRAPLYFQPLQEPSQKQVSGFDAATHFAALPSVLAQQPLNQYQPAGQSPQVFNGQFQPAQTFPQAVQSQYVPQNPAQLNPQSAAANPQYAQPDPSQKSEDEEEEQNDQEQPQFVYQQSYQPQEVIYQAPQQAVQYQPQQQQQGFQPQQGFQFQQQPQQQGFQPQQPAQYQPQQSSQPQQQEFQPQSNGYQPQLIYQAPQQAPANQYQPQPQQNVFLQAPEAQYVPQEQQAFLPQAQLVTYQSPLIQQYQNGLTPQIQNGLAPQQIPNQAQLPQQINQGQDALQSGLDANQQGNGVEESEAEDSDDSYNNEPRTAVAVATAFGTRTQPRVAPRYGAPAAPSEAANPQPPTDVADSEQDSDSVAVANAFSGRRKSAKLRSRRVRPLFTLDRSGHLVLAQQN